MMTQKMEKSKKDEIRDLVILAAKELLRVCDGAHARDNQGFNGYHAKIVRDMMSRPYFSDKMIVSIQKMLRIYTKTQLPNMIGEEKVKILVTQQYADLLKVTPHKSAKNHTVKFGKYKGKTFYEVAESDPSYLRWMAKQEKYKESSTLAKETVSEKEITYKKFNPETLPEPTPVRRWKSVQVTADPEDNNKIQVTFSFSKEIITAIKTLPIPDRRWNKDRANKSWTFSPLAWDTLRGKIEAAEPDFNINISEEAQTVLDNANKRVEISNAVSLTDSLSLKEYFKIKGLNGELMPFQKVGVQFLYLANGRALLADQMGLGKTIQALAYLQLIKPEKTVIVVPASLKINWEREAFKWLTYTKKIKRIKNGKQVDISEDQIVIINYDVIKKWKDTLLEYNPEVVIFDESHYIKNQKAQRSQTAQEIGAKVPKVILLTGTPVLNRPKELYQQLRLIDSTTYHEKGFFRYAKRYCNAHQISVGKQTFWNFDGSSNTEELNEKLKNVMIRRTKDKVLTELPDKTKTTIYLQSMSPELRAVNKEYATYKGVQSEKKHLWDMYVKAKSGDLDVEYTPREIMQEYHKLPKYASGYLFSLIERMKQAAVRAKLKDSIQWIEDFIENDEKIVVFTTHNHTVDTIMSHFGETAVKLTGSDDSNARQKAIDDFQTKDNVKVFVGNLKAAGVGITLTAASSVAFIELGWTPGEHIQAEDRVHRIGQKDAVNIYYLVVEESVEPIIAKTLLKKSIIVDKITDGNTEQSLNILQEVMKEEGINKTEELEDE